jgi:hypothetical protein
MHFLMAEDKWVCLFVFKLQHASYFGSNHMQILRYATQTCSFGSSVATSPFFGATDGSSSFLLRIEVTSL